MSTNSSVSNGTKLLLLSVSEARQAANGTNAHQTCGTVQGDAFSMILPSIQCRMRRKSTVGLVVNTKRAVSEKPVFSLFLRAKEWSVD